jgi:hypothetical protein
MRHPGSTSAAEAVKQVPPGMLWQEIAPVFLDVVITVVCKHLSH